MLLADFHPNIKTESKTSKPIEPTTTKNVQDPEVFKQMLTLLLTSMYEIFELSKETDLPQVIDGVQLYSDAGKTFPQVATQFNRPSEFLQCLLDLLRCSFDSSVIEDFLINGNFDYILDNIPSKPFQLGYISRVSAPEQSIAELWEEQIAAALPVLGYDISKAKVFIMIGANQLMSQDFCMKTQTFFSGILNDTYLGFIADDSLDWNLRLSMWLVMK